MAFKNFKQTDSRWANDPYSAMTVKAAGCGPTSIADAVYDLDSTITPKKIAAWMEKNGCACPGSGTYYSGMVKALKHYGYSDAKQLNGVNIYGKTGTSYVKEFLDKIKTGKYVGIACMGKSIWTTSGHYVFVYSYDGKTIKIYDPYNTRTACESTTKTAWEKYVKYLFLFSKKVKTPTTPTFKPYKVITTVDGVKVRKTPSTGSSTVVIQTFKKKGKKVTIVAEKTVNGVKYGQLKKCKGWIKLKNTKKV